MLAQQQKMRWSHEKYINNLFHIGEAIHTGMAQNWQSQFIDTKSQAIVNQATNRRHKNWSLKATDCVGRYNRNIESVGIKRSIDQTPFPQQPTLTWWWVRWWNKNSKEDKTFFTVVGIDCNLYIFVIPYTAILATALCPFPFLFPLVFPILRATVWWFPI